MEPEVPSLNRSGRLTHYLKVEVSYRPVLEDRLVSRYHQAPGTTEQTVDSLDYAEILNGPHNQPLSV